MMRLPVMMLAVVLGPLVLGLDADGLIGDPSKWDVPVIWQIVLLIAATFVSEDLTCITAGLLIQRGQVEPIPAIVGCFIGTYLGDMSLWVIGAIVGPHIQRWPWLARRLPHDKLDQFRNWLNRNGAAAIMISRLTPGARVPLYLASGMLGMSLAAFALWTFIACMIWTPSLVLVSAWLGEQIIEPLERWLGSAGWAIAAAAVLVTIGFHLALSLSHPLGRARLKARLASLWRWEFWPAWVFYMPLLPWIIYLSLRHRGFTTITAANPGIPHGGFVGESKSAILAKLPDSHVAPFTLIDPGDIPTRLAALQAFLDRHATTFPLVLKPDQGQRGTGVRLARSLESAAAYLEVNPRSVVAQVYHPGPHEAGIFYYRLPGEDHGRIFSITDKQFPVILGDGKHTLEYLIWHHPRFRMQAAKFLNRHAMHKDRILADGESFTLAMAGNHCQGTMFLDGSHLITPQLSATVDRIARHHEGFYFGRFDVRYTDPDAFMAGNDLTIIELNGITSESTNVYDPSRSLLWAWSILFRQWWLLFKVGRLNRDMGHPATGHSHLIRTIRAHYRGNKTDTLAD
jgi:membrane protein DedA with SNARE-associated domain